MEPHRSDRDRPLQTLSRRFLAVNPAREAEGCVRGMRIAIVERAEGCTAGPAEPWSSLESTSGSRIPAKRWSISPKRPARPRGVLGFFARFGIADKDTNPVEWSASGGLGGRGVIPYRDDDLFGAGYLHQLSGVPARQTVPLR